MSKNYFLLKTLFLNSKSLLSCVKVVLLFFVLFINSGCGKSFTQIDDNFDISLELPSLIEVSLGDQYTFSDVNASSLIDTDNVLLESENGILYVCPIVSISSDSFTISLSENIEAGYYIIYIKRDNRKKQIGKTYISIVDGLDFEPDSETTVYGIVSSEKGPVEGVVVSDGFEVACTNSEGIYQLKSKKKLGYVFMSIPANYEALSDGILPQFYKKLKGSSDITERIDFSLKTVENQNSYKVFMFGDMHLANRTNDVKQFMDFIEDVNLYREQNKGEKMYAITLGDMTWDLYWYSNNYEFGEYLFTMNTYFKDLQVFHTIGNHDYDYKATSDIEAAGKFVDYVAPTYYSFNIGKIHYIVLDDIDCSNYDGTTSRNYEKKISSEQLDWLVKDLSYIDKSVPLVVIMHAQVFYPSESNGFKIDHDVTNTTQLFNILDGYKVNFVTGHTHYNYNVTPENTITGGRDIHEHNVEQIIRGHKLAINALDFQSSVPFIFDQLCIKYNIKVLHPYNFGWGSMVAVVTPESKQLCEISTDYRSFETKMANYIFQSGLLPNEFLTEVSPLLKRFLESKTPMTPPQLSVGSWLTAALCTRITYAASLNKPLKKFPDFYFISTLM